MLPPGTLAVFVGGADATCLVFSQAFPQPSGEQIQTEGIWRTQVLRIQALPSHWQIMA